MKTFIRKKNGSYYVVSANKAHQWPCNDLATKVRGNIQQFCEFQIGKWFTCNQPWQLWVSSWDVRLVWWRLRWRAKNWWKILKPFPSSDKIFFPEFILWNTAPCHCLISNLDFIDRWMFPSIVTSHFGLKISLFFVSLMMTGLCTVRKYNISHFLQPSVPGWVPIRNSSASSVNQTSDVTRWISWWRNRKPCQHHNKFKWQQNNGYNTPR